MINSLTLFIGITLMYSTPLVFAALGGVVSERSGVTNLGIEGMMTIGAVTGATVGYYSGSAWAGFIAAGLAGGLIALLHAFAAITCKADQTISGIAINLIGPGVALFVCRLLFDGATMSQPVPNKIPKLFGGLKVQGALQNLNVDVTVVIAFLLAVFIWFFLYKTNWGLHIRAVGEHPAAADTMGIHVYVIRYLCVLVSGVLAGFGGAAMTLAIIPQLHRPPSAARDLSHWRRLYLVNGLLTGRTVPACCSGRLRRLRSLWEAETLRFRHRFWPCCRILLRL